MFKTLSDVKKSIKVGDVIKINNKIHGKNETRKIVKVQTNAIVTSPMDEDREIWLNWQRARNTRVENNKVQFLLAEEEIGEHMAKKPKAYGIDTDWWLELEIIK